MPGSDVTDRNDMGGNRLYFRQLLAGRDFAVHDQVARQMVNFVYLIGDRETGEAVAVDPAYSIKDLLAILDADGMRLTGALATHYHPDHVGGTMGGFGYGHESAIRKLSGRLRARRACARACARGGSRRRVRGRAFPTAFHNDGAASSRGRRPRAAASS